MKAQAATLVVDARCTLGEGPVWHAAEQALFWTDIAGQRLWRYGALDGATESWPLPDRLACFALCASGGLLLGLAKGLYWARLDAAPGETIVAELVTAVEPDQSTTRLNDGRTDRDGNFVFGTLNEDAGRAPLGGFYQFSQTHGLRRLNLNGVAISNSLCFSPDGGTIYFCDSLRRTIECGEYDSHRARVSHVRPFVRLADTDGLPDGSIVDSEGGLWNAEWGQARVRRYLPDGRVGDEVTLPALNPTSVAFGGRALDELFITSSRQEMTDKQLRDMPGAGGLFCVRTRYRGIAEQPFQDR